MEQYLLPGREIRAMLEDKGVAYLYHANTVLTSLTFLKEGALLTRGYVEAHGLQQTEQKSDDSDKVVGVWDSVFLDYLDHHLRWNEPNNYGPVLFRIKLDILSDPELPGVVVTKGNPWYWKEGRTLESSYFLTMEELRVRFFKDFGTSVDGKIMFTLPSAEKYVNLHKYLDSIVIDKPAINFPWNGKSVNIANHIENKIAGAMQHGGLGRVPLVSRSDICPRYCNCTATYRSLDRSEFLNLFGSSL